MIGIFLNSAARVPFTLLQAHGRADLTAKLHLIELPIFAALLVAGVHAFGITGAALAWTLRVALDTTLLYLAAWMLHRPQRVALASGASLLGMVTAALLVAVYVLSASAQWAFTGVIVLVCAVFALRLIHRERDGTRKATTP